MSPKLLQVNYKFAGTRGQYEAANLLWAQPIADRPGLRWKIWLMNESDGEAGGIVLFDDDASRQAYVDDLLTEPDSSISNVSIKRFNVLDEHTAITRGPVRVGIPV